MTDTERIQRLERIVCLLADGLAPPSDPAYDDAYRELMAEVAAVRGFDVRGLGDGDG